jgi:hypothetical protein
MADLIHFDRHKEARRLCRVWLVLSGPAFQGEVRLRDGRIIHQIQSLADGGRLLT